jgi:hypothetical protein
VGQQEQRLARPSPRKPRDEVALAGMRRQHLHVGGGEPGRPQPRGHRLGRLGVVAYRVGGVGVDELAVDLEERLLVGRPGLRAGGQRRQQEQRGDDDAQAHGGYPFTTSGLWTLMGLPAA